MVSGLRLLCSRLQLLILLLVIAGCSFRTLGSNSMGGHPPVDLVVADGSIATELPVCDEETDRQVAAIVTLHVNEPNIMHFTIAGLAHHERVRLTLQTQRRDHSLLTLELEPVQRADEEGRLQFQENVTVAEDGTPLDWDVRISHETGTLCQLISAQ